MLSEIDLEMNFGTTEDPMRAAPTGSRIRRIETTARRDRQDQQPLTAPPALQGYKEV